MRLRVILFEDDGTVIDESDHKIKDMSGTVRTSLDALQYLVNTRDDFSWKRIAQLVHIRLDEVVEAIHILRRRMDSCDGLELMEAGICLRDQFDTTPAEAALAEARMKDGFESRAAFVRGKSKLLPEKFYG